MREFVLFRVRLFSCLSSISWFLLLRPLVAAEGPAGFIGVSSVATPTRNNFENLYKTMAFGAGRQVARRRRWYGLFQQAASLCVALVWLLVSAGALVAQEQRPSPEPSAAEDIQPAAKT